ncbi:unnamed protein product [Discula destructiva]
MTDTLPPASTQSAPPALPHDKTVSLDAGVKVKPKKEEDSDGVIQCICNFSGDDGYTVECEECQTWQHIACYYPGRKALEDEFRHACADCKPREHRDLDRQKAVERMHARLAPSHIGEEPHDKRSKRAPSKSYKKKPRPTDLHLNGHATASDGYKHGSPHDQPPTKKAKTSHKSSHSISIPSAKRSPSHGASSKVNPNGHPLSPATTPPDLPADFESHPSAPQFLVRHETPFDPADSNTIATLATQNKMAVWSRPECPDFRNDAGAELDEVVLKKTPSPLYPPLRVDKQEHPMPGGRSIQLPRLITPSAVDIDVPMMELIGLVGLQQEYCRAAENGYKDLSAPLPFVFFPEHIPLYIDARREGSNARHVRRSCRPNARLVAYLSENGTWHFWLVSDRSIAANEEITLDWEFHLEGDYNIYMKRLLGLDEEPSNEQSVADVVASIDQKDYNFLDQWIALLMSYYGACACNRGPDCAFDQFRRLYHEKQQARTNGQKRKRARSKPHTLSPTSTGQATNSRAASEGHFDEMHDNDDSTTPGSALYDKPAILTEPTEREKRKAEQYEKTFQKLEQQPPRKKKKSVADGSTNTTVSKPKCRSSISHVSGKSNGAGEHRTADARASTSNVGSPASAASPASVHSIARAVSRQRSVASDSGRSSASGSRSYCDTSVQTEPEPQHPASRPQRKIMSLTMRLMKERRKEVVLPHNRRASASRDPPIKSSHSSPSSVYKELPLASPTTVSAAADTSISDVPPIAGSPEEATTLLCDEAGSIATPVKAHSPDLRVHMPPVPPFASPASATATTTPMSANSLVLSPFSTAIPPSPLVPPGESGAATVTAVSPVKEKKKWSLAAYKEKKNKVKEAMEATAAAKSTGDSEHTLESHTIQSGAPVPDTTNGDQNVNDADKLADSTASGTSLASAPAS